MPNLGTCLNGLIPLVYTRNEGLPYSPDSGALTHLVRSLASILEDDIPRAMFSPLIIQSLAAFGFTLVMIAVLSRVAPLLGLMDTPSDRKRHVDSTPLVGGLAILATLVLGALIWGNSNGLLIAVRDQEALWVLLGCATFLVVAGSLDDRFDLGVFARVGSELLVALVVIETLDLRLLHLGDLLSIGNIQLSDFFAYPFTMVAIFGIINAFNMLDGIDGLLATLVIATLITFHLFTELPPDLVTLFIGSSLAAFLVSNLKLAPFIPKTFLGDAGSRLLGFIVVCLLLGAASAQIGETKIIKPATALFLVALPLFDMVFTTVRRILRKGSPFAADRGHIHHLMQDLGFSDRRALVLIVAISVSLNFLGLMLHRSIVAEYHQFGIFCGCFALYCLLASQAWRVAEKVTG